jgi:hypothetical protein
MYLMKHIRPFLVGEGRQLPLAATSVAGHPQKRESRANPAKSSHVRESLQVLRECRSIVDKRGHFWPKSAAEAYSTDGQGSSQRTAKTRGKTDKTGLGALGMSHARGQESHPASQYGPMAGIGPDSPDGGRRRRAEKRKTLKFETIWDTSAWKPTDRRPPHPATPQETPRAPSNHAPDSTGAYA